MANKYNIYKIPVEHKDNLLEKLEEVGLTKQKSINEEGFECSFYLSESPDAVDIWWMDLYKDFIDNEKAEFKNHLFFGVYVIYNDSIFYAISLGKSYFYLQSYCDMDFGLNLAARIINTESIKLKNSKFFRSKKNKTITTYSEISLSYDSSESIYMLKASPENKEIWGETMSFGRSVQMNIDLGPKHLTKIIQIIEDTLLQPAKIDIPMVLPIKNEEIIEHLNYKLFEDLKSTSDTTINIDEIQTIGVTFVFAGDNRYQIYLPKSNLKSEILDGLNITDIKNFLLSNNIDYETFEALKIKVIRDEGRGYSKTIKQVLDYIDHETNKCLIEGTWNEFNDSYIKFLQDSVDKIDLDIHDLNLDYIEGEKEEDYNKRISTNHNYVIGDKDLETIKNKYKIEIMDLYKDGTLYFVKKGTPQKLTYCIDQAINSLRYIKSDETSELMKKKNMNLNKLTLWLLPVTKPIKRLSEIRSLILLMKLSELRKECMDKGIPLSIRLNYKKGTQ